MSSVGTPSYLVGCDRPGVSEEMLAETVARAVAAASQFCRERRRVDLRGPILVQDREIFERYRVWTVPSAVVADETGRIASATVSGVAAVEALVASVAARTPERL